MMPLLGKKGTAGLLDEMALSWVANESLNAVPPTSRGDGCLSLAPLQALGARAG